MHLYRSETATGHCALVLRFHLPFYRAPDIDDSPQLVFPPFFPFVATAALLTKPGCNSTNRKINTKIGHGANGGENCEKENLFPGSCLTNGPTSVLEGGEPRSC